MKNSKKLVSIMLVLAALASASCGTGSGSTDTTTAGGDDTTVAADGYTYDKTFGGKEFRIASTVDTWSMHMQFDRDEQNGDSLNDAIYNRNRRVEDLLDITIKETAYADNKLLTETIKKSVEADDDFCDLSFTPPVTAASLIVDGYFYDLTQYDGFKLDKEWYNQSYNEQVMLGGKLYFGMSDATVGLLDGIWALFFNEDMMTDLSLDFPYELVRNGGWTYDKMLEYLAKGASLNGDESYTWNKDGNSIYGLSMTAYLNYRFMNSFGERMIENGKDGLVFTAGSERFYDAVDKLKAACDQSKGMVFLASDADEMDAASGGYLYPFVAGRAMFLTSEISKAQKYRDCEFNYGIVPFPKLDENQENYVTTIYQDALGFSIPVTCKTPEDSAVIFDALAYEGRSSVVRVHREQTVEAKGLRNEDSIEMLGILVDTAYADVGSLFGLNGSLIGAYNSEIKNNTGKMASIIDEYRATIGAQIETINEKLGVK